MEPIISPALFYWASVFSAVKLTSFILLAGVCIFIGVSLGYYFDTYCGLADDDEDAVTYRRCVKILAIVALALLLIAIFVPSKETMMQMQLARLATGENLEIVLQRITEAAKEIIGGTK
jgi:predicted transporter